MPLHLVEAAPRGATRLHGSFLSEVILTETKPLTAETPDCSSRL